MAFAFESRFYKPLDLKRAARDQHGPAAILTAKGDHLYDWKAQVGEELKNLDLKLAVSQQYGNDWKLVAVGVHKFDWKALCFAEPEYKVIPALLIASDRFYDIVGVRSALDRYRSVLINIQNWYDVRVNATFRLLQPLIVPTALTSTQWNDISNITQQPPHRSDLFNEAVEIYEQQLPAPGAKLRVVITEYTGESADVWFGAASLGSYAVVPPRAASLDCPPTGPLDRMCADASYAIGHELGHTFFLDHSCTPYPSDPQCRNSIMESEHPPGAILLRGEICMLMKSPFFDCLAVIVQPLKTEKICVIGPNGPSFGDKAQ